MKKVVFFNSITNVTLQSYIKYSIQFKNNVIYILCSLWPNEFVKH